MNKSLVVFFSSLLFFQSSFCKLRGELISGSLKSGNIPNSVIVVLKSNQTFSGQFTNVQFTIQIPADKSYQPVAAIIKNPMSQYIPSEKYSTLITHENGFYNYLFSVNLSEAATYNFIAEQEIQILEIAFTGDTGTIKKSRLAHLPDGGTINKQMTFYVEINGNDNTQYSKMFYGNNAINVKSYSSYSFVTLQKDNTLEYTNSNNSEIINNTIKTLQQIESFANSKKSPKINTFITNLYPNPTHDFLYINFDAKKSNELVRFFIYDNLGKLIKNYSTYSQTGTNTFKTDVKEIPSGMYELKIISDNQQKNSYFIKI